MSKKLIQINHCILGYGYASLIAYHKLLKSYKHEDVLILQNEKDNPIFTVEYDDFQFSPLPIFPVAESELYKSDLFSAIPKQSPIAVSFSNLENFDYHDFETNDGSLAEFMVKVQGIDKNLCLGAKQWGLEMFNLPFSQVQSKIKRHYVAPKGNTRMGYLNGQSLFKYAVEELAPKVFKYDKIQKIVIEKKEIHLDHCIINYNNLISTIPIHYLLDLCNLDYHHDSSFAGCHFHFFTYEGDFKENQMIYDCDYHSDIIRIFSIRNNFLMVQLNGENYSATPISKIKDRVKILAPNISALLHAKELHVPMCYPLELITDHSTLESISKLRINNVLPFGRFGNWEYSDLHELNWSSLA